MVNDWAMPSPIHCSSRPRSTVAYGRTMTVRVLIAASAPTAVRSESVSAARTANSGRRWAVMFGPSLSTATRAALEPPQHPCDHAGPDSPKSDLGNEHDCHQAHEPWPQVEGQARPAPVLEKGLLRLRQHSSARHLRQLAQEGLVHAEVPELLPVRHHQPRQLGAD